MPGALWTSEEVETLRKMYADGATYRDVAEKLGRTHSAVWEKARKIGISKRENTGHLWSESEVAELIKLAEAGVHGEAISRRLGRTRHAVNKKAAKLGIELPAYARKSMFVPSNTLCWTCTRSTGRNMCAWARWGTPVDGWETRTAGEYNVSHDVVSCPQYEKEMRA